MGERLLVPPHMGTPPANGTDFVSRTDRAELRTKKELNLQKKQQKNHGSTAKIERGSPISAIFAHRWHSLFFGGKKKTVTVDSSRGSPGWKKAGGWLAPPPQSLGDEVPGG